MRERRLRIRPVRDEDVRASCFGQLAILTAEFGEDVRYRGGLARGFAFRGERVPYLSPQKGIFRAAAQRGPAALSIQTSYKSPYDDSETPDGFAYAYRAGRLISPTTGRFGLRTTFKSLWSISSGPARAGTSRSFPVSSRVMSRSRAVSLLPQEK